MAEIICNICGWTGDHRLRHDCVNIELEKLRAENSQMEKDLIARGEFIAVLQRENEVMREAVKFYSLRTNWIYDKIRQDDYDGYGGKRARAAILECDKIRSEK